MPEEQDIPKQPLNEEVSADPIMQASSISPSETQPPNMEVHHHPNVEKKNFKEYFLEFIMIFLAVTMGFFAENIREHFVNKEKENQYIKSFYEDLSNDERDLPVLIKSIRHQQLIPADSLPALLSNASTTTRANDIYRFLRIITRQQGINVFVTSRTIEQLKNAGEMRLITNKQITDSLVDYYKDIAFVADLQQFLAVMKGDFAKSSRPLLNSFDYDKVSDSLDRIVDPPAALYLRSTNADVINDCLLGISNIKSLSRGISQRIIKIKGKAGNIKQLIHSKYEIEK
jgi:hypothetical protein